MNEASLARTHFPSKRDAWLSIVLWVAATACVVAGVFNLTVAASRIGSVAMLIVLSGVAALILWILYGTHYRFSGETLDIRSGPFRFRVPLGEVVSVEPSRNPLSGPACSLDRLLIRYGRGQILVSPEDRLEFLDAVAARGSRLVREGDRVLQTAAPDQAAAPPSGRSATLRCLLALALAGGVAPAAGDEVAFDHVTVVDVVLGKLVTDRLVRVSGDRIVDVSPSAGARIPPGTRVVDGTGRFLIPGLWDMHAHYFDVDTPGCPEVTFPLSVAHGVTGARDVEGYLDLLLAWRAQVESGRIVGPAIVGTGPMIDGVPVVYPPMAIVARTPGDGRRIVDVLATRGADFVKAYEMLRRDTFFAVVDQAGKRGLPVAAHVPLTVLAGEASDAGVRSFEHLRNIELACSRDAEALLAERSALLEAGAGRIGMELRTELHRAQRMRALDTHDAERCTALLRKLAKNGTWQAPTLFVETTEALRPDLRDDVRETLRFVPELQRADWEAWSKSVSAPAAEAAASWKRHADWGLQLVRRMNDEGVGLLAGTDISVAWMVPGAGLHEELRMFVEAGLTPLEALRTATWNAARYFGKTDQLGSVAPGRIADLVLVDADPLVDIRNARRIRAVVAKGRYLDRSELDGLLATAERMARSGAHDLIHRPGHVNAAR